ncbi:HNH endonuclease [Paenibacillus thailandensis]|uniref:HNH endonuclease n=1 Tax=Paenibacillus thailandensis TaxID=393250 RepID=A0ABW5R3K4_9BACL
MSSPAQAANQAVRRLLRQLGKEYDLKRGMKPFSDNKDIYVIRRYFKDKCCYCRKNIMDVQWDKDHLIPMNKEQGGLHAWGNIVPSCKECNATKQGSDWIAYIQSLYLDSNQEQSRVRRIKAFVRRYKYDLDENMSSDISKLATNLYISITKYVSDEISIKLLEGKNILSK